MPGKSTKSSAEKGCTGRLDTLLHERLRNSNREKKVFREITLHEEILRLWDEHPRFIYPTQPYSNKS